MLAAIPSEDQAQIIVPFYSKTDFLDGNNSFEPDTFFELINHLGPIERLPTPPLICRSVMSFQAPDLPVATIKQAADPLSAPPQSSLLFADASFSCMNQQDENADHRSSRQSPQYHVRSSQSITRCFGNASAGKATVLVTGGLGFIGSHTVVELLESGYNVVIVDNLSNCQLAVFDRICKVVKAAIGEKRGKPLAEADMPLLTFHEADVTCAESLDRVFSWHASISWVIHFAALKAVSESVKIPIRYYQNNLSGLLTLLEVMGKRNVKKLIFSSSATVYGSLSAGGARGKCGETLSTHFEVAKGGSNFDNVAEDGLQGCVGISNPYGRTKWMAEAILEDVCFSDPEWTIAALRYFNPVGAHKSGELGEDPLGIPNNLMPNIVNVVRGSVDALNVFGLDYNTADGSAIRDYIHVVDLAKGHLAAMKAATANYPNQPKYASSPDCSRVSLDVPRSADEDDESDDDDSFVDELASRGSPLSSMATSTLSTPPTTGTNSPTFVLTEVTSYVDAKLQAKSDFGSSYAKQPAHEAEMKDAILSNHLSVYNLGTGSGYTVLEMVEAMRKASGHAIPVNYAPRRQGDQERSVADPSLANEALGWKAEKTLKDICEDTVRYLASVQLRAE